MRAPPTAVGVPLHPRGGAPHSLRSTGLTRPGHNRALCAQGHSERGRPRRAVPGGHQLLLRGPGEALHVHGQPVGGGEGHRRLGPAVRHPQVRGFHLIKATVASFVLGCWFMSVFVVGGWGGPSQLLSCSLLRLG